MVVAVPLSGEGSSLRIEQRAHLPSFLGLSLKNGLLNLITLTLYRFWGKTEVRRRIWASTYVNDDPLEYTGRGVELFVGFLIALAILGLPFLLATFGAQLLGPAIAGLIVVVMYIGLMFLVGFGMFTAFRYMASRTALRGVRFHLKGRAMDYALSYFGYGWLSAITLGWFWPAAQRRLAGQLWGGLRFGDGRFRFDLEAARKVGVYGPYALGWVGLIVLYIVFAGALFGVMSPMFAAAEGGDTPPVPGLGMMVAIYLLSTAMVVAIVAAFAPYHAASLRSVAAGTSFEGVRFSLDLKAGTMVCLMLSNIFLILVSLGFLMPFVQARTLKLVINRLQTSGAVDLDAIRQSAQAGPRTGEGLADAFGISPI